MSRYVMIPWFEELANLTGAQKSSCHKLEPGYAIYIPNPGDPVAWHGHQFVNDYTNCTMMVVERPSFPQEIVTAAEAVREDDAKAFMLHDALLERGWDGMAKAIEGVTVGCRGCEGRGYKGSRIKRGMTVLNTKCGVCEGTGKRTRPDHAKLEAVLTVILGEFIVPIGPLSGIGR